MPKININGAGAGAGGGSGGPSGGGAGASPFFKVNPQEGAAAEFRLRKLFNDNQKRLQDEALRTERDLQSQKNRAEKEQFRSQQQEQRRMQTEKQRADRDYARWWQNEQRRQEREARAWGPPQRPRNWSPGGGGGSGGGSGGGGGGRGGRGFSEILGRAGHGATVGAILGSLGQGDLGGIAGAIGGTIGGVIGELVAGPLGAVVGAEIGKLAKYTINPVGGIASAASSSIDFQRSIYAQTRAAGGKNNAGLSLYNSFGPGDRVSEAWRGALGVTPQEVIGSIQAYGGLKGGVNGAALGRTLSTFSQAPAFSAMAPGTAEGLARQGVGLGLSGTSTGNIETYLTRFAPLMEMAMAKGMDQSRLLESMQGSMSSLASTGSLNISAEALAGLTARLAATGTPGGRDGSTAASITAGIANNTKDVTKNPFVFTLLSSQLPKFGNLKTQADVERFVGRKGLDPTMVSRITDNAKAGNAPAALAMATALIGGDSAQYMKLLNPAMGLATGNQSRLNPFILSSITGTDLSTGMAFDASNQQKNPTAGYGGNTSNFIKGMNSVGASSDSLIARGVPADAAALFEAEAKRTGTDPLILATIAAMETGGSYKKINLGMKQHPGRNNNGTTDYGVMGVNSASEYYNQSKWSPEWNIRSGDSIFRQKLARAGGDVGQALENYNGSGPAARAYRAKAMAMMGGGSAGVDIGLPSGANTTRANAGQGELFSANEALKQLAPSANAAALKLDGFTDSIRRFMKYLDSTAPVRGGRSVMP